MQVLLDKHKQHKSPYETIFKGIHLQLHPKVFNPNYTKVSGFLADNLIIKRGETVLEMFSGSGALSFITARKARKVVGIDISPYAVTCARINAEKLGLGNKVSFRKGNLWHIVEENETWDVIFGNPPLLPLKAHTLLESTVADSPSMDLMRQFIEGVPGHLKTKGRMYMTFSNASNSFDFINGIADSINLIVKIKAQLNVLYEIYSILEFRQNSN